MHAALDDEISQVLTLASLELLLAGEKILCHITSLPGTSGRAPKVRVHAVASSFYECIIIGIRSRSTSSLSMDTSFERRIDRSSCQGSFRCEHSL